MRLVKRWCRSVLAWGLLCTAAAPSFERAHNMGLKVAAEGVEDEAALRMLRGLDCDPAQRAA